MQWPMSPQLRHSSTALPLSEFQPALSWRLWLKAAGVLQRRQVLSVRAVMMPTEDTHIRTNFATVLLSSCTSGGNHKDETSSFTRVLQHGSQQH